MSSRREERASPAGFGFVAADFFEGGAAPADEELGVPPLLPASAPVPRPKLSSLVPPPRIPSRETDSLDAWRMSLEHMGFLVDNAHFLRRVLEDGVVEVYRVKMGAEQMVQVRFPDGGEQEYEGQGGAERMVSQRLANNMMLYYTGPRGFERINKLEHWTGERGAVHYMGEKGNEEPFKIVRPDGQVRYRPGYLPE